MDAGIGFRPVRATQNLRRWRSFYSRTHRLEANVLAVLGAIAFQSALCVWPKRC
jgi:hypothetical protein